MSRVLRDLWHDDDGFIISVELLMICSLLLLGILGGLIELRNAIQEQFLLMAGSIRTTNVAYQIPPVVSTTGASAGTVVVVEVQTFSP